MYLATNLVPHALMRPFYHSQEDCNEDFLSIVITLYFLKYILFGSFIWTAKLVIMAASVHSLIIII